MNAKKAEVSKVWQQQGVGTRVYHTDSKQILYQSFFPFYWASRLFISKFYDTVFQSEKYLKPIQ